MAFSNSIWELFVMKGQGLMYIQWNYKIITPNIYIFIFLKAYLILLTSTTSINEQSIRRNMIELQNITL